VEVEYPMRHWSRAIAVALLTGLALVATGPGAADAHERRTVAGEYTFVVGFLKEPAFEGETNGIDLRVTRAGTDEPVEGLEKTLRAEVIVGGNVLPLELRPRFRQPGAYNGEFVPTRPGSYIFRFTGTVEGRPVDERFESGPGRFDDVKAVGPLQFPDKVPSGVELQRALAAAESRAATATVLAVVSLALGAAGLLLAAWAVRARRPLREATAAPASGGRPAPAGPPERL